LQGKTPVLRSWSVLEEEKQHRVRIQKTPPEEGTTSLKWQKIVRKSTRKKPGGSRRCNSGGKKRKEGRILIRQKGAIWGAKSRERRNRESPIRLQMKGKKGEEKSQRMSVCKKKKKKGTNGLFPNGSKPIPSSRKNKKKAPRVQREKLEMTCKWHRKEPASVLQSESPNVKKGLCIEKRSQNSMGPTQSGSRSRKGDLTNAGTRRPFV